METRRWINQSQPQTLYMATILAYLEAVLGLIFGSLLFFFGFLIGLAGLVALFAAGYGIANERRWGYLLGVTVVGIEVALLAFALALSSLHLLFSLNFLFVALWPTVLFILLLHPQSREYQRIWFK